MDTLPEPEDDNVDIAYTSGFGDDSVNLQLNSDVVAHEDVEVHIVTNDGNDSVVAYGPLKGC